MKDSLCGNFLEKVDETYIDYSIISLSKILVQVFQRKIQRQREQMVGVSLIRSGHFANLKF